MCRDLEDGGRRCPGCTPEARRRTRAEQRAAEAQHQLDAFIGATPFRPESVALMRMSSRPSYFDSDEWVEFDEAIHMTAERRGIEILEAERAQGLWDGETEPAGAYTVTAESFDDVKAWAGEVAGRYDQDSVMVGVYTSDGPDKVYSFDITGHDPEEIIAGMRQAGIHAGRTVDGRLEVAARADEPLSPDTEFALTSRFADARVSPARIEFVEKSENYRAHVPIKELQTIRQNYAADHGFPVRQRMPHLTDADDIAAAHIYANSLHEPNHPRVARSYRAFRRHVAAQWNVLNAAGYRFEPWHGEDEQPYADSAAMLADLRDNKHLFYYRTEVSQHTEGALPPDHPMAQIVTLTRADGTEQRLVANDVFRAVHDTMAHSEGHQFGPFGEKRAWWTHRSSLPREARLALWCETRGQVAWTNAGPHMTRTDETGRQRLLRRGEDGWIPITQRPYAEQKCINVHPSLL